MGSARRDGAANQLLVLLDANRAAAKKHDAGHTVLRGAASHTGAYLLEALREAGYEIAPVKRTRTCPMCRGLGSIPGFWAGSTKTCTSCHGRGERD